MNYEKVIARISTFVSAQYIEVTSRGNTAIKAALSALPKGSTVLIPSEGGWLTYKEYPLELGLKIEEVKCVDAVIDLEDLEKKLREGNVSALLYHHLGGYFAAQPIREIYGLCKQYTCMVILDVCGSFGTPLLDPRYADVLVGSFGKWKLIPAHGGGFVACRDKVFFDNMEIEPFRDEEQLGRIVEKFEELDDRIIFLLRKRAEIAHGLADHKVLFRDSPGFVVVVEFDSVEQKEDILNFCKREKLEWTECPRYIRLMRPAISIEVKRLEG
ncbi:DegT/DnrJ/EryC1/StrS aminotransferase family protein [Candidatus Woesearchaeota archaeon]|nr:DegT/DnrJ/EryC1/StrS aminotransferase family protein [Candidatus Woesearchaeota archaeon]